MRKPAFLNCPLAAAIILCAALAIGSAIALLSCSDSGISNPPSGTRPWFYEHEFAHDKGLAARPDHVVILQLVPGDEAMAHGIPYEFAEGGPYLFGIEADDPFITRAELLDANGAPVLTVERGDGGAYMDLPVGAYSLKVFHDGSDVPPEGTVAFIRLQQTPPDVPAAEAGEPAPTGTSSLITPQYPAFVPLRAMDVDSGFSYLGLLEEMDFRAMRPRNFLKLYNNIYMIFSFEPVTPMHCTETYVYPPFEGTYRLHFWGDTTHIFSALLWSCDNPPGCPPSQAEKPEEGATYMPGFFIPGTFDGEEAFVHVEDNGDGTFLMWSFIHDGYPCSPIYMDAGPEGNLCGYYTAFEAPAAADPPQRFQIDRTYTCYMDGTALDTRSLQKGDAAIYIREDYKGPTAVLHTSITDLGMIPFPPFTNVRSVAFGHHTDTTAQFFGEADYTDLLKTVGVNTGKDFWIQGVKSIYLFDSKKVLISSNKCPYCNLAGVDLSGMTLDKADLSYANLMQAALNDVSLKKADMRFALLNGANLTYANLEGANLCGASLQGTDASDGIAASLQYAFLKNVNLANANLSGTACAYVNFYSDYEGVCGVDPECGFSKSCATAASATLDGANFTNAYLNGVDFSSASVRGVKFVDAMLEGVLFTGANLGQDPGTGAATDFTQAFLGGADFTGAVVTGVTFANAFVSSDPGGNCMLYELSGDHTQFRGFEDAFHGKTAGDSICVTFSYTKATALPTTGTENICPNGASGPCSDPDWTNPKIPMNKTTQKASLCDAAEPVCSDVNYDW